MKQAHPLKIYIDRLKDDDTEQIFETIPATLFDVAEKELCLKEKVTVSGQAYLAKNHLIFDLKLKATISMPCSICNEATEFPLNIDSFTHTVEICEVKSAVYDYKEEIRSALLIKVPQFVECHHGHCPQRKDFQRYMTKPADPDVHTPFSDLEL